MSICPAKTIPYEMKTTRISVYSYENKFLKGIVFNPFFEKEIVFENVMQLITIIERVSNAYLYPQRTMELRRFYEQDEPESKDSFDFVTTADFSSMRPIATFDVELIFRQNASWQGNIIYSEKNQTISFRSMLELLTLIDSALSEII